MKNKLFLFTGILISALLGLLVLLIHWGNKSIELRESLFVDQVNIAVDEMVYDLENDYYCFSLVAEVDLPKMDKFFIADPSEDSESSVNPLELSYMQSNGEYSKFSQMPMMGPAHLQMMFKFDFDDIPDFKDDTSLSAFEVGIRDYYDQYLFDDNGVRLIDTNQLDSLLFASVAKLYPEAQLSYNVTKKESGDLIFTKNIEALPEFENYDVNATIFQSDENIPDLLLSVEVLNKRDMFSGQAWSIYTSALILALVTFSLIFFLVRMQLHQKKMLKVQKDFVHGMTHEFNTPISNINLVAQNLVKSSDQKMRKAGEILKAEGNKLQLGINLVLTTALIEKDELLLQKDPIDVKLLLAKTLENNKISLSDSGINLNINLSQDDLLTNGDAFHLENVFQNILNNARKHSNADLLKVESERQNGDVVIRFSDNGKGIEVEDRKRIFEKFESRKDTGTKNGYGLGLYYSKMILQMHGGNIQLLENGQKGSVFSIKLPA